MLLRKLEKTIMISNWFFMQRALIDATYLHKTLCFELMGGGLLSSWGCHEELAAESRSFEGYGEGLCGRKGRHSFQFINSRLIH